MPLELPTVPGMGGRREADVDDRAALFHLKPCDGPALAQVPARQLILRSRRCHLETEPPTWARRHPPQRTSVHLSVHSKILDLLNGSTTEVRSYDLTESDFESGECTLVRLGNRFGSR